LVQQIYQILRADIARCPGRKGTAAQATDRGLEGRNSLCQAGVDVNQSDATGVVKVESHFQLRHGLAHGTAKSSDQRWRCHASRVTKRDPLEAEVAVGVSNLHHLLDGDIPLEGTA